MGLAVAVEEVAAALSRAVHTKATMPDYTVSRVAFEDDDEVWSVKSVREGCHPGDVRLAVKDPETFWPSGRSYSDRKRDAFFKAQRANMCDQLTGCLVDIIDKFVAVGVVVTVKGQPVEAVQFCTAHLHELDTGFQNPMLKSPDGHVTLVLTGLIIYEGRDDEGAVGHSWLSLTVAGGQRWGVDISATQLDVYEYSEEGYPLVIFDNGIVEGGKVVQKGDARFRGSKPKTLTVEAWREDYTSTLRGLVSKPQAEKFFEEMKDLRREVMSTVTPKDGTNPGKWEVGMYQSMVEDRAELGRKTGDDDDDDEELAELMKEMGSNPFVKIKGSAQAKAEAGDTTLMAKVTEEQEARDRARQAREAKEAGNKAFKEKRLSEAAEHYARALELFPPRSSEAVVCHSNRAQCYLSDGQLDHSRDACLAALDVDPTHGKSRYRLAKVYKLQNLPAKAKAELRRLIRQDPNNADAQQLLHSILQESPAAKGTAGTSGSSLDEIS